MIIDVTSASVSNAKYWTAERFLVRMEDTAAAIALGYYEAEVFKEIARYTPVNGAVLIDVTDFVRAYHEIGQLGRLYLVGNNTRFVGYVIAGRINPAGVLIPRHALMEAEDPAMIVPPQKMLLNVQNSTFVMAEFYAPRANEWHVDGFAQWDNSMRNLTNFNTAGFALKDGDFSEDFRPELADTCKPFALVEWQSFSGATRRHVFYIVKQTNETEETISLENVQNEYTEIKGETDGFSLRLEDLTRYDLWYYSDMITSSDVRVSIDGGSTFYRVQVTDKKYTIPDTDAGRFSTLEIAIKFRKYDAVNL